MFVRPRTLRFLSASAALLTGVAVSAQTPATSLPFGPGEKLSYKVKVAFMGASGESAMWITGPEVVRGTTVWVLHSEAKAGVGFVKGTDHSMSWFDPSRSASLRFVQHEHHIVSHADDSVEMQLDDRRWTAKNGLSGQSPTDAPLDALSFIYYIRTMPLADDSLHSFSRHYDAERSPTTICVTGRDTMETALGRLAVVHVEMRVRDKRHYDGEGVLKLVLSDDARRLPITITSVVPRVGTTVMTLSAATHAALPSLSSRSGARTK
jgi:hypothetical protein